MPNDGKVSETKTELSLGSIVCGERNGLGRWVKKIDGRIYSN
jgi:hypothetical protein